MGLLYWQLASASPQRADKEPRDLNMCTQLERLALKPQGWRLTGEAEKASPSAGFFFVFFFDTVGFWYRLRPGLRANGERLWAGELVEEEPVEGNVFP